MTRALIWASYLLVACGFAAAQVGAHTNFELAILRALLWPAILGAWLSISVQVLQ